MIPNHERPPFEKSFFKWDSKSKESEQRAEEKADDSHERKVYAKVDKRDKLACVVSGLKGNPHSTSALERLHHHHILQKGRDLGPTETWNVCLVHRITHKLIHKNALTIEGNADKKLTIAIKATSIEELFGKGRTPPPHVRVIPDDLWAAWLDEHACRMERLRAKKAKKEIA
jgi:hypothetical protein